MIYIAHRGNVDITEQNSEENSPNQILECLRLGLDVEIDVWRKGRELFLGHDEPKHKIEYKFLENKNLWCHAKNHEALSVMVGNHKINCFWHENDD